MAAGTRWKAVIVSRTYSYNGASREVERLRKVL